MTGREIPKMAPVVMFMFFAGLLLVAVPGPASGGFGDAVIMADVDADGDIDLVVGDPGDDGAGTDAGAVFMFLDPPSGNLTGASADHVITGPPGSWFGAALAVDDLDGDNATELLVGSPNASGGNGTLFIFSAPFGDGTYADAARAIAAPEGSMGFGAAVATADVIGNVRPEIAVGSVHRPAGHGLVGEYFGDTSFSERNYTRVDPGIDFDWGTGAPAGLPGDGFAVRWSGLLYCNRTGNHTFHIDANDGARLWIDGTPVFEEWDAGDVNGSATAFLVEGYHDLRFEYGEETFEAYVSLRWTTPGSSGAIPAWNLFPAMASPLTVLKGASNISAIDVEDSVVGDVVASLFGSSIVNSSGGFAIGSPSVGRVYRYDEDFDGDVRTYVAGPLTKGSGDETGENIADLQADDNDFYEVDGDSDVDDLEVDTFDVSSVPEIAKSYGTFVSITLKASWYTEQYYCYQGNGVENYLDYREEGGSYEQSSIRPEDRQTETHETFDLMDVGIQDLDVLGDLDVHFNNGDAGMWIQSVFWDYIVIEIKVELPVLEDPVVGPLSFGASLAADGDDLYVGAPWAGPVDLDAGPIGIAGGGLVFRLDGSDLPESVLGAGCVAGAPYSLMGHSLAADGGVAAAGAPLAFYGSPTGAVHILDGIAPSGSGLVPLVPGDAGTSVSLRGAILAAGNPGAGVVHLVNISAAPSVDAGDAVLTYAPDDVERDVEITTTGTLNLTAIPPQGWTASVDGSQWARVGQGTATVEVGIATPSEWAVPVAVVGRSGDGLLAGLDMLLINALEAEDRIVDLFLQRRDDAAVQAPRTIVEGEESMVMPVVRHSGAGAAPVAVSVEDGGSYVNRTVAMPSDVVSTGESISLAAYGVEIWNATQQSGATRSETNVGDSFASWRVIVRGAYVAQRAGSIRLKFYAPVALLFSGVGIAETDDAHPHDVIGPTWTPVTFNGSQGYYEAAAGEHFVSDWIPFGMDSGRNYSVTFRTSTGGTHRVTYWAGNGVFGTIARQGLDYREDLKWSDDTVNTYNFAAYLLAVEAEERATFGTIESSAAMADGVWTAISWTADVPDGTAVLVAVRSAPDAGGRPGNWSGWHGPPGQDHYAAPSALDVAEPWIQVKAVLRTYDGTSTPVLHDIALAHTRGTWSMDAWNGPGVAIAGTGTYWSAHAAHPARGIWHASAGSHTLNVTVGSATRSFPAEVKTTTPTGGYDVLGYVRYPLGGPAGGAPVSLTDERSGAVLNTSTDADGLYHLDLSGLAGGYLDGDLVHVTSWVGGFSVTDSFRAYSEDLGTWLNMTLGLPGFDVYVVRQTTPYGMRAVRFYRESDGMETDRPVASERTLLRAQVANRGSSAALDVAVNFLENGTAIGSAQTFDLVPGEIRTVERWWSPAAGTFNITVSAGGMWNEEHFFWADLWDSPYDGDPPVDFTTEAYNTQDDLNTFGIDGSDPMDSFDGWDWKNGAYGAQDLSMTDFGDPQGESDYTASGSLEVELGRGGELSGSASGAWGVQFYIDPDDYTEWSGGFATLGLTYSFNDLDNDLEEAAAILGRLRSGGTVLWLGSANSPVGGGNISKAIFVKSFKGNDVWERQFEQDVTSFINHSGHYYLDLGPWLQDTSSSQEGVLAAFDDVSIEFLRNMTDAFPSNDVRGVDVSVLPSLPNVTYDISGRFYDPYDDDGMAVNFTVIVDNGTETWSYAGTADPDGSYNLSVPVGNWTEASELSVEVDDLVNGTQFIGGDSMFLYSYETPSVMDIPLFCYGFRVEVLEGQADIDPGESFHYSFSVESTSNWWIVVDLSIPYHEPDWTVSMSGQRVNKTGTKEWTVAVPAYSTAEVTVNVTARLEPEIATPGTYEWTVEAETWFKSTSMGFTTVVNPIHRFDIDMIPPTTIDPGERVQYRVLVTNTGNDDSTIFFNLSAPAEWNVSLANSRLPLGAGEDGDVVFTVSVPPWPASGLIAGTDFRLSLNASTRGMEHEVLRSFTITIGQVRSVLMNGSAVGCLPGAKAEYLLHVRNLGNGDEEFLPTLAWNASFGNLTQPTPETIGPNGSADFLFKFTPSSDLNVSRAGRVLPVNASFAGAEWTMYFIVGEVHDVAIGVPGQVPATVGKPASFEVTLTNRGNGVSHYLLSVEGGDPEEPVVTLSPWSPTALTIYTTPGRVGANNVTVTVLRETTPLASATVTVVADAGSIDVVLGSPSLLVEGVEIFDVCPYSGDIAYVSNGTLYFLPAGGSASDLGPVNATAISVVRAGDSPWIAIAGQEESVLRLQASGATYVVGQTWNFPGNASAIQVDSSIYSGEDRGVYLLWATPTSLIYRSFTESMWNPEVEVWASAPTSMAMRASGSRVHIVWGASDGVRYEKVSFYGVVDVPASIISTTPSPTAISVSEGGVLTVAWATFGLVEAVQYNGSWGTPVQLRDGTSVCAVTANGTAAVASAGPVVVVDHLPAGSWPASRTGAISGVRARWDGEYTVLYLDGGDLWSNLVDLPLEIEWGGSGSIAVIVRNRGTSSTVFAPDVSTTEGWSSSSPSVAVGSQDEATVTFDVTAPASMTSQRDAFLGLTFEGVALAHIPLRAVGGPVVAFSVTGSIAVVPGNWTNGTLVVTNDGNVPVDIAAELAVPGGWEVDIDLAATSVSPGGSVEIAVTIRAPESTLTAEDLVLTLTVGSDGYNLTVPTSIELLAPRILGVTVNGSPDSPAIVLSLTNFTLAAETLRAATVTWYLPNGMLLEGANVTALLRVPGNATVQVVASNQAGTAVMSVPIMVGNRAPTVTLVLSAGEVEAGTSIVMTAVGADPEGRGLTYTWHIEGADRTFTGPGITFSFESGGAFRVQVTVTDEDGATATDEKIIVVTGGGDGGEGGADATDLLLAGALLSLLVLLVVLLVLARRKRPASERAIKEEGMFETIIRLWPQYVDVVKDLDPAAAEVVSKAKPINYDASTKVLVVGVPDDESYRRASMPQVLEAMERGIQELHGERVFVEIEGGHAAEAAGGGAPPSRKPREGAQAARAPAPRQPADRGTPRAGARRPGGPSAGGVSGSVDTGAGKGGGAAAAKKTVKRAPPAGRTAPTRRTVGKGPGGGTALLFVLAAAFALALVPSAASEAVTLGDIDGDGDVELIAGFPESDSAAYADGPLARGEADMTTMSGPADSGFGYAVAAINGTFAVLASDGSTATAYLYSALGAFNTYDSAIELPVVPAGRNAFAIGDQDGDGEADLAVASADGYVWVLGGPGFATGSNISLPPSADIGLAFGDLDGKKGDELVVGLPSVGMAYVLEGGTDYRAAYIEADLRNGTSWNLTWEDGLTLQRLGEVENGDGSDGLSGWTAADNEDGNQAGSIRLLQENVGDWRVSPVSGAPTVGFGSVANTLTQDGQGTVYSGALRSPTFTLEEGISYLHVWYRWEVVSFDQGEGVYVDLCDASNGNELSSISSWRVNWGYGRDAQRTDRATLNVEAFEGREVYLEGELDGDDGRDSALMTIDDIYFSDADGRVARKSQGSFLSDFAETDFEVSAVVASWDADLNGETMVVRIRTSTAVPWKDADAVANGEITRLSPVGEGFQYNITFSTTSIGNAPVLRSLDLTLLSDRPGLVSGRTGAGFGASIETLSGKDPLLLLGSPEYYSRGAAFLLEPPKTGESVRIEDAIATVNGDDVGDQLGAGVGLADLAGDEGAELLVSAPGEPLFVASGGAVHGFVSPSGTLKASAGGLLGAGLAGLGSSMAAEGRVVAVIDGTSVHVIRGWHDFSIGAEDAAAVPGSTVRVAVLVSNIAENETVSLQADAPDGWDSSFVGGSSVTVPAGGNATVQLELVIPEDAPVEDHEIPVHGFGADGITYAGTAFMVDIFVPDLYPNRIFILRGDGTNVSSDEKRLVVDDTANLTVRFYTDSRIPLPSVEVRFFQEYDTGSGWDVTDLGVVHALPKPGGNAFASFDWTPTVTGEYKVGAEIDSGDDIRESEETNEIRFRKTIHDSVPDNDMLIRGTVLDTGDVPVVADVEVMGAGGYSADLSTGENGTFELTITLDDYYESETFWINASLDGPPGSASNAVMLYSEDMVVNTTLRLAFEGIDVALIPVHDPAGMVDISVFRYGDGTRADTIAAGRASVLEADLRNRGDTPVAAYVNFTANGNAIGGVVLSLDGYERAIADIEWTPATPGTYDLAVSIEAQGDLYAPNNDGARDGIVCIPLAPSVPVWINGTVLDVDATPLGGIGVPMRNVEMGWTNSSITTAGNGRFSALVNASSYREGDRIDINVTYGGFWGNQTIHLYSYDGDHDVSIILRKHGLGLVGTTLSGIVPGKAARFPLNMSSECNYNETYIASVSGVPAGWTAYFLVGTEATPSPLSRDLAPGEWVAFHLVVVPDDDWEPWTMMPATYDLAVTAWLESHPITEEMLNLTMEVLRIYNFTAVLEDDMREAMPGGTTEFNITLTNLANGGVTVLLTVSSVDAGPVYGYPSSILLPYGSVVNVTVNATVPPLGESPPAGQGIEVMIDVVALKDPSTAIGMQATLVPLPMTAIGWAGDMDAAAAPGERIAFTLTATNVGNTPFSGNVTWSGEDVDVDLSADNLTLAMGGSSTITVWTRPGFSAPGGGYLPAGSVATLTVTAGGQDAVLSIEALPLNVVTLVSNATHGWGSVDEPVTFGLALSNPGNVEQTVSISIGGQNASWASVSPSSVTLAPRGTATALLTVGSDAVGTAMISVVSWNADVISNTITLTAYIDEAVGAVLLYSAAELVSPDAVSFSADGDAVVWSNSTGVHALMNDTIYDLGVGSMPIAGHHEGQHAFAWLGENGTVMYADAFEWMPVAVAAPASVLSLSVVPGPEPSVAVGHASGVTVYTRQGDGSWAETALGKGAPTLVPFRDRIYLLLVNSTACGLVRLPGGKVVEELPIDGVLDVHVGRDVHILGTSGSSRVLLEGKIDGLVASGAPAWAEALVATPDGAIPVGAGPGVLRLARGDERASMPLRAGWPVMAIGDGYLPLPVEGAMDGGTGLYYWSRIGLLHLPMAPVVGTAEHGEATLLVYGGTGGLSLVMGSDIPYQWSAAIPNGTGFVSVSLEPDGALAGTAYGTRVRLTDGVASTNSLTIWLYPAEYVTIDAQTDGSFVPGAATPMDVTVTNSGSTTAELSVRAVLPRGWSIERPDDLAVAPWSSEVVVLNVTAPAAASAAEMTLFLNGTTSHAFTFQLKALMGEPVAEIIVAGTVNSLVPVEFDSERSMVDNWTWYFGDGSIGWGPNVTHTYARSGSFTVELVVRNVYGTDMAMTGLTVRNRAPVAAIQPVTKAEEGRRVAFSAEDSHDPDGDVIAFEWDFGDGRFGEGAVATHTYDATGMYTVVLKVTDDKGTTAEITLDVRVSSPSGESEMGSFVMRLGLVAGIAVVLILLLVLVVLPRRRKGKAPPAEWTPVPTAGPVKRPAPPGPKGGSAGPAHPGRKAKRAKRPGPPGAGEGSGEGEAPTLELVPLSKAPPEASGEDAREPAAPPQTGEGGDEEAAVDRAPGPRETSRGESPTDEAGGTGGREGDAPEAAARDGAAPPSWERGGEPGEAAHPSPSPWPGAMDTRAMHAGGRSDGREDAPAAGKGFDKEIAQSLGDLDSLMKKLDTMIKEE